MGVRICLNFTVNKFYNPLFGLFEALFGIFTLFALANRPLFAAIKQCKSTQKHLSTKLEIKSKQILRNDKFRLYKDNEAKAIEGLRVFSSLSHLRTRFIAGVIVVESRCNKNRLLGRNGPKWTKIHKSHIRFLKMGYAILKKRISHLVEWHMRFLSMCGFASSRPTFFEKPL